MLQHIQVQYAELKPIFDALVTAYPQLLQASWFTWEAYLWAVQFWYAYAMQVSTSGFMLCRVNDQHHTPSSLLGTMHMLQHG